MTRMIRLAVLLTSLTPMLALAQTPAPAAAPATAPTQPDAPPASGQQADATPDRPRAETQVYYRAGDWDAFSGRTGHGALCGVGTTSESDGRSLAMRFDIPGDTTSFTATKPGWSIPEGTPIAVVMQVGLNPPMTENGVGHGHTVGWTLDRDVMVTFDAQFRAASSMTLAFPDGNEPPWQLSLAGSSAISDTFGRCITDLSRQVQAVMAQQAGASPAAQTQPFARH